jgi:hypothetical protein
MRLISHRGNTNGPNPIMENNPEYIEQTLKIGYDVEIDVWYKDNDFYLGHDYPKYIIDESFLENEKIWSHAKDIHSLLRMNQNKKINCFWHQNDDFTLTSKGFIWTYPDKELTNNSICVLPDRSNYSLETIKKCYGICSDFIIEYD